MYTSKPFKLRTSKKRVVLHPSIYNSSSLSTHTRLQQQQSHHWVWHLVATYAVASSKVHSRDARTCLALSLTPNCWHLKPDCCVLMMRAVSDIVCRIEKFLFLFISVWISLISKRPKIARWAVGKKNAAIPNHLSAWSRILFLNHSNNKKKRKSTE